jgi:hypothetical protein
MQEIWLVESCRYCHPSGHAFECDPVRAFASRTKAEEARETWAPSGEEGSCLRVVPLEYDAAV